MGATIRIGEYACYNSEHDIIFMPSKFDPLMYKNHTYATVLLHELGHWTGHESRLCRPYFDSGKRSFLEQGGNSELIRLYYAEEEIVAELTAAQLALEFGIYWSAANSAEYLSQYLNQTDKPLKHFFQDAHRAVNYLKRWKY